VNKNKNENLFLLIRNNHGTSLSNGWSAKSLKGLKVFPLYRINIILRRDKNHQERNTAKRQQSVKPRS
jgi:hypothetical protein